MICVECPFRLAGEARAALQKRADEGGWIACVHSVADPVDGRSFLGRVRLMHAEVECAGARLWRRARELPL